MPTAFFPRSTGREITNLVHGEQLGRHFSGFYDGYYFLPLYVFCGQQLLVSYLRPAYCDAAHHAGAILALLVRRQAWPPTLSSSSAVTVASVGR